ncbi:hypothetical protein HH219_21420 [Pseudoalteromonas sp. NEC-BIFX-2020_015]|uniref:hypothetical protein n=1 Tax=Pseudoalteromonas sp. NEC-BIFX-2020_015 TaxID=2729544 RepID=UPI00146155C1|nr:hypothetical protein [Pseudoalteromonas sp. NEC-BIFX-2020_015]NMR28048.1 hypothetical protein [Pseudoalteromonas sp. NEC-BIFX-2020_015]
MGIPQVLEHSDNEFNDLEDFKSWFKDDSTIKNTEQLEPDLRIYATRITDRLLTGGDKEGYEKKEAQHIDCVDHLAAEKAV